MARTSNITPSALSKAHRKAGSKDASTDVRNKLGEAEAAASEPIDFGTKLSNELWVMIFKELYGNGHDPSRQPPTSAPPNLKHMRLVSHRFNDLAMPVVYYKAFLSANLITSRPTAIDRAVALHIQAHSRVIAIRRWLHWDRVISFLDGCKAFQELKLVDTSGRTLRRSALPQRFIDALHQKWSHVRLHLTSSNPISIPPSNLITLNMDPLVPRKSIAPALYNVLVSATKLETLSFASGGALIPTKGRLPAIKNLALFDSSWFYTLENFDKLWNFSLLEELDLTKTDGLSFLTCVPGNNCPSLRIMKLAVNHRHNRWGRTPIVCDSKCELVGQWVQNVSTLERLKVICCHPAKILDGIANSKNDLRSLKMISDRNSAMMPKFLVPISDANKFANACPNLVELVLEVRAEDRKIHEENNLQPLVELFAGCANLQKLDLHVFALTEHELMVSKAHEIARNLLTNLGSLKVGRPFKHLCAILQRTFNEDVHLYTHQCSLEPKAPSTD